MQLMYVFFYSMTMKSRKLFASMLVMALTFSFLITGCEKKADYSDDAMMEGDAMMEKDGDAMMEKDGDAMMEKDGDAMMEKDGDAMEGDAMMKADDSN